MRFGYLAALAAGGIVHGAAEPVRAALIDFETAGDVTNRLRLVAGPAMTQTSNGAGNDFSLLSSVPSGQSSIQYVDDDGAGAGTTTFVGPITVSVDLRALVGMERSSVGVYFTRPGEQALSTSLLALFNVDDQTAPSGTYDTTDQMRFFSAAQPSTAAAGTNNGGAVINSLSGIDVGAANLNTLTVTYSVGANNTAVMSMTAGGMTLNSTFPINSALGPQLELLDSACSLAATTTTPCISTTSTSCPSRLRWACSASQASRWRVGAVVGSEPVAKKSIGSSLVRPARSVRAA
jgi:hypothetical protein